MDDVRPVYRPSGWLSRAVHSIGVLYGYGMQPYYQNPASEQLLKVETSAN